MARPSAETNLRTYDTADVASHYAGLEYLTPCERLLFESYVRPGGSVLDLGVGGGRTTAFLSRRAERYVGVDYAPAMISACQRKFPDLQFVVADAADLSAFQDAAFDAVVFAFNGIDYVFPAEARLACLQQIRRILKPEGVLIFSSHNPRAIFVRKVWNRERLRNMASLYARSSPVSRAMLLAMLSFVAFPWALVQSSISTVPRLPRLFSHAFWSGEGNMIDRAHGGLFTHYAVPERFIDAMDTMRLRCERIVNNDSPQSSHRYATDWYYYVFAKR